MNRRSVFVLWISILSPVALRADAGTALMWTSAAHLVFGNLIIGIGEGLIVGRFLKVRYDAAVLAMILANYASSWIGGLALIGSAQSTFDINITNLKIYFYGLFIFSFVVTVLIEFPFVLWIGRGKGFTMKRLLIAAILPNLVSYPVISAIYWKSSGTNFVTQTHAISTESFHPDGSYRVAFIDPSGSVISESLDGKQRDILKHRAEPKLDVLIRIAEEPGKCGLYLWHSFGSSTPPYGRLERLTGNIEGSAQDLKQSQASMENERYAPWVYGQDVIDLTDGSGSKYHVGSWDVEGLIGSNEGKNEKYWISLETPLVSWSVRNASQLPGDVIVFRLGKDQICAINPPKKIVTLLARGTSPVVIRFRPAS